MTTTTPGPWTIANGHDARVYLIDDARGHAVGELVYADARKPADARLIAAAPALLAALQAVADYWAGGDVPAEIDAQMREAIARATGSAP